MPNSLKRKFANLVLAVKHGQVGKALLWRLSRIGVSVEIYYVFREKLDHVRIEDFTSNFSSYSMQRLGPDDMAMVADLEYSFARPALEKKLSAGHLCFGLMHENNLAAVLWCDLEECHHRPYRFKLAKNEGYIYAACTTERYRGKGLAPYLRYLVYCDLIGDGIDTFYSATDYYNKPALKLRHKLNFDLLKLCLHTQFRRKRQFNWVIRNYCPDFTPNLIRSDT